MLERKADTDVSSCQCKFHAGGSEWVPGMGWLSPVQSKTAENTEGDIYETGERAVKGGVHPSGKSSRGKAELPSCPYSADNLCHGHPCFGAAVYHAGNSQDRADCGGLQRKETYGFSARCIKPSSAGILPGAWNQRRRCVSHKKQKTS